MGITQANSWSDVSSCFAKSVADRSCLDAQDGFLYEKKTNPKICYKDYDWANYLTGYWGYQAVCGGAICEMEPGLALSLTIEPYRSWWVQANCQVVQCQFNSRRLDEATSSCCRCNCRGLFSCCRWNCCDFFSCCRCNRCGFFS